MKEAGCAVLATPLAGAAENKKDIKNELKKMKSKNKNASKDMKGS